MTKQELIFHLNNKLYKPIKDLDRLSNGSLNVIYKSIESLENELTDKASERENSDYDYIQLIKSNQWIAAIKLYRERNHTDLKESKDYIDRLRDSLGG